MSAFTDDSSAVAWLDSERPNLVAVAQHAADHGPHDVAWLLADHLRGYFWLHRHTVDWLAVADAGLAAATADHDAQGVAAAHINLGQASRWLARFDDAVEHYAAARSAAQQAGWTQGEATALGSLANTYRDVGELHSAAEYHGTAGTLFRRLGNQAGEAVSLSNLGNVYCELGRLTDAADALEAAVAAYRAVGSRAGEATALTGLGPVYLALGRYTDASDRLRRALAIREDLSNSEGAADCRADLANVQREAGQYIEAVALATKAIDMTRELVDARVGLAEAGLSLGDNASAKRLGAEALTITRRYGFAVVESDALIALANIELAHGDVTAAGRTPTRRWHLVSEPDAGPARPGSTRLSTRSRASLRWAELLEHAECVHQHPRVDHLAVEDPVDDDPVDADLPARRRDAHELVLVGTRPMKSGDDPVALDELFVVRPGEVGERGEPAAQPGLKPHSARSLPG